MPILHRNIIPDVPAWTADNGKIVFRNGFPSHRANLCIHATYGGVISFNDDGEEPVYPPATNYATSFTVPAKALATARTTAFSYGDFVDRRNDENYVDWINYGNILIDFGPEPTGETPGPGQSGTYIDVDGYRYWWSGNVDFLGLGVCLEIHHAGRLFCRWDDNLGSSIWRIYTSGFSFKSTTWYSWDDPPYDWIGAWCEPPSGSYGLCFECAEEWPADNLFRRGHVARFSYAGPAGNNIDLSGLYIDLITDYAA